jgi:2,4-dienoyl-CoA reductase (NADPH2)
MRSGEFLDSIVCVTFTDKDKWMSQDLMLMPITINRLEIKNRIFMPAMHLNMCKDFLVSDQMIEFYTERACGGAGIITVGYASVDNFSANPTHIGAHSDAYLPGLTRLASAIKENGASASVQLNHAGRYNFSANLGGEPSVAPSALASRFTGETPRELTSAEIKSTIESFAQAALRVKKAGFDAVEILTGTGYLISEFLSEVSNRRSDEYGGSLENRMRFGLEVIRAVRQCVGPEFPLLVRINGNDFMPGGIGHANHKAFAKCLEAEGADAFVVNVGWHESRIPQIQSKVPRGVYAYLARGIKEVVTVPVIASHRINDPVVASELLANGFCDMVAMGRALIADPDFPEKVRTGRSASIVHCIGCLQGCFDNIFKRKHIECLCNPRVGHELETATRKASTSKKVLVAGGGAAGLSAALEACSRGHQVTLIEKSERLGGQLLLAGAAPGREEFIQLANDLSWQVADRDIQVQLDTVVDMSLIDRLSPEVVILATGGTPIIPPVPGVELPHVVQAWDVLTDKVRAGNRVVVIGGGAVGVEVALALQERETMSADALKFLLIHGAADLEELRKLAVTGSREVTVLEMFDKLGTNFGTTTRWVMLEDVKRYGIKTEVATRAIEITPSGVKIEKEGEVQLIDADTVVLAVGTSSYNPLQDVLEKSGIPCHVVGDAAEVGMAFDAIHQGFAVGHNL